MPRVGCLPAPYLREPLVGNYLVLGPAAATRAWVMAWLGKHLCQQPSKFTEQNSPACGECLGCQWLATGCHPDYLEISSDPPGGQILLEQMMALLPFLSTTPQAASARAIVIWAADSLTLSAANAFLKTLEGPNAASALILMTSAHPSLLLGTLKSRCFSLHLPPNGMTQTTFAWTSEDEQALRAYQTIWLAPHKVCQVSDHLAKVLDLKEVLYSLLKIAYVMARSARRAGYLACAGLSPENQRFLEKVSVQLGMHLWLWIDRVYGAIQDIQQGIALNGALLLESLFVSGYFLGNRELAIHGGRTIPHHQR